MSRRLTCVLFLISLCQCASGALLAVDYGSEWVKASVVAPGRAPVSIVLNEASKRKQAAAVSLSGGERTVGDEALALATRYPERVYLRARDMLGRPANSSALAQHLQALYLPYAPLLSVPSRGTVALRTSEAAPGRDSVSAEELCGSVLQHVQRCAQDGLPPGAAPIRDAVLTVPPFWSQAQRLALLDCAALAGLNVLSLASEPAAAALQYGIDREPPPNSTQQLVVIVDVGAGSSSASLVAYSGWKARESTAKSKPHGQFEIKAVTWDETAGAEALDVLLAGACPSRRAARGDLADCAVQRSFPQKNVPSRSARPQTRARARGAPGRNTPLPCTAHARAAKRSRWEQMPPRIRVFPLTRFSDARPRCLPPRRALRRRGERQAGLRGGRA